MSSIRCSAFRAAIVGCAFAVFLGGCGSSESGEDESAQPTVNQVLDDAAAAMATVESASFTIEQENGTVFIDDGEQLAFQSADGRFAAPASSDAILKVDALGFATEVGAIAIDGELWFTNPLTGEWTVAPESFTFDPATLFDPDTGFPAMLTEASDTARFVDDAAEDGDADPGDRHHLRATVSAQRVEVLTGGLVSQAADVDLWIDRDSDRIVEVRFDLPLGDTTSNWRMVLADYDAEVNIDPPELTAEG